MKMKKLKKLNEVFKNHSSPNRYNLVKCALLLWEKEFFRILLINIEIDLKTGNLNGNIISEFISNYTKIDLSKDVQYIEEELKQQMIDAFSRHLSNSRINFKNTDVELLNVIDYVTLIDEHIDPSMVALDYNDFYLQYREEIERINILGLEKFIIMPWRRGEGKPRIFWVTKYNELLEYCERSYGENTGEAINEILGLRRENLPDGSPNLLLGLVFPKNCDNTFYKPSFIDGCVFSYPNFSFLNSEAVECGYGLTRSTNKGKHEFFECVSKPIHVLPSAAKLVPLGYCSTPSVDNSTFLNDAIKRLNNT